MEKRVAEGVGTMQQVLDIIKPFHAKGSKLTSPRIELMKVVVQRNCY